MTAPNGDSVVTSPVGDLSIQIHRDQRGAHWSAYADGVGSSDWQPTPEAALIGFITKARVKHRDLATTSVGVLTDEDKATFWKLARFFQ